MFPCTEKNGFYDKEYFVKALMNGNSRRNR